MRLEFGLTTYDFPRMAGKINDAQQRAIRQMTHFQRVGQMPETKTAAFAAQNDGTREPRPAKCLREKTPRTNLAASGGAGIIPALVDTVSRGDDSILQLLVQRFANGFRTGMTLVGRAIDCSRPMAGENRRIAAAEVRRSLLGNPRNIDLDPAVCTAVGIARSKPNIEIGSPAMREIFATALLAGAISGYWIGTVTTPAGSLPMGISINEHVLLDAAPLGFMDKPVTIVSRSADRLQLEMRADEQLVTAELSAVNDELRGNATLGSGRFPITLHRAAPPVKAYAAEDVSVRSGDVNLAATLYLPKGTGPAPAIVFVAGLTPRGDSTHFLADAFADRGIAVIAYDHRGVGKSTGQRHASFATLADDAAAVIRYLTTRKEIDANRIGIRGQSQGAWIAPLAATHTHVAFAILTGGGGVQPWQSETYAIPARMRAAGYSEGEIVEATRYMQKMFDVARSGEGWDELSAMMTALHQRGAKWFGTYGPVPPSLTYLRELWDGEFAYDPKPALAQLTVPVLALEGENDVYSPPLESLRALESALGSHDRTLRTIRNATHDFRLAGGPLPLLSDEYVGTLLNWTAARAGMTASDPTVNDHRIVSRPQNVVIDVDPTLKFIGRIGIDIRDAAHAERVIYADADASGRVRRLWIAQFENMLPQHRGVYDVHNDHPVRIGPFTFNQAQGRYSFAAAIAAKPGLEADQTRTYLAQHGMQISGDLAVARFETLTDASHRAELIIFYWEDLTGNSDFAAFAEKAKTTFTVHHE